MRISFDMPLNESQLTLRNDAGEVLVQGLKQEGSWAIKKGTCYHGPFEAFYDIKIWGKDNRLTFVADSGFGYFVGFDEYWLGPFCAVHDLTFLEDQGMCIVVAREEDRWNVIVNGETQGSYPHRNEAMLFRSTLIGNPQPTV